VRPIRSWSIRPKIGAELFLCKRFRQKALRQIKTAFVRFWRDEHGVTNLEYGIVVAAIALAIFDVLGGSRFQLPKTFRHCSTTIRQPERAWRLEAI
jgi:Flp pilus assembly pilin Flp